ncbi:P-loop containing nucleoside triphosphate hydrolase protein [Blyttiomyces helicus]|uniref:P-loop containing nucleoside triphosphate hydrolase protein n=1 Tax=Blyttiomyces helicus TaxID=388810 RepID=A0A4P9WPI8_9FUNG|nr:P-loop containing nucleoside triphosphate hydrolase protein [Blyttiomyces helicus]|eukprot:RKO93658.1 P-loop containing nucleoside triphosphate hydrolase protein [Blyttiomyces helicus]
MTAEDTNIKIAVRVRPFNGREMERSAQRIITMDGPTTIITNPKDGAERKFTFDYRYEFASDPLYLSHLSLNLIQQRVFQDLGEAVVENAWKGINASILAYGQTGSGKSYSMFGYGLNKGLIPMIADRMFTSMAEAKDPGVELQLTFSMLEIYNEKVYDLLNPAAGDALRVRNTTNTAFYVEGLKPFPVTTYQEIESLVDRGTRNRTVASTKMNASSSRSHTILILQFIQISKVGRTEKRSIINLVDLAGSERVNSAGTEGERLKEGVNINSSLSVLGQVIAALVQKQNGKKGLVVPYRDSTLTKLLANALGGNSRTIMIAALSPADINYEETLGTLRFVDRAKQIKTAATVNENPLDKCMCRQTNNWG